MRVVRVGYGLARSTFDLATATSDGDDSEAPAAFIVTPGSNSLVRSPMDSNSITYVACGIA